MNPEAGALLRFWFGEAPDRDPAATAASRQALWWGGDAGTDRDLDRQFGALRRRALRGELDAWMGFPRERLAFILLIDQCSRSVARGTAQAFEHDALARRACVDGLARGDDRPLAWLERVFFYLPLEHAESREDQARSVALYEALAADVPEAQRPLFETYVDYARRHREVIERFGRFPHRNAILGRASTDAEKAFLREPGSSF